jgi:hypothetical protein
MISIVSTNFRMSGGYLNHLDTYAFLREYRPTYHYMEEAPLWDMMLQTKRSYGVKEPIKISSPIKNEIIITDIRGLIVLEKEKIQMDCRKLIVMDCLELTFHLNEITNAIDWFFWFDFSYANNLYNYLWNIDYREVLFLMPPSNYKKFIVKYPDLYAKTFFKKIHVDILKKIRPGIIQDVLHYERRPEVSYHEQFGRRIFEHILMGSQVYFDNDPYMLDDGLSDYLKYYNIQFEGKRVTTESKELSRRMKDDGEYLRSEVLL